MEQELFRDKISKGYLELAASNDKDLEDIVLLASEICGTPIALITLLDLNKQHFIAKKGIQISGTEREVAFCNETIKNNDLFVVYDATKEEIFKSNPLVTGFPNIKFYAGYPLKSPLGVNVGSLCVIDHIPRNLTSVQEKCLQILAGQVIQRLELGLSLNLLQDNLDKLQEQKELFDQSEVMLRAFFDTPAEYLVLLNNDLQVVSINKAAKEIFKKFKNTVLEQGMFISQCLRPNTFEEFKKIVPMIKRGKSLQVEKLFENEQLEKLWAKLTISPSLNNKNEVIGISVIGSEINKQKQHEERIKIQNFSLSKIAQMHSHQLRHPVSSILGIINMIKEDKFTFNETYLAMLEKVTQELDGVIHQIVDESRGTAK
ncbi:MAG: PAS domain-containing protein [Bacteroidota bacterium]|nr:PAS domain-containing protein [Bacteroidota bacterium]